MLVYSKDVLPLMPSFYQWSLSLLTISWTAFVISTCVKKLAFVMVSVYLYRSAFLGLDLGGKLSLERHRNISVLKDNTGEA